MKTLMRQIRELLLELLSSNNSEVGRRLAIVDGKLDHVLLNQELLATYLGMIPGSGATQEELDALSVRISETKARIEQLTQAASAPEPPAPVV